jgi:hypothetical protein
MFPDINGTATGHECRPTAARFDPAAYPALTCWAIHMSRLRRFGLRFARVANSSALCSHNNAVVYQVSQPKPGRFGASVIADFAIAG